MNYVLLIYRSENQSISKEEAEATSAAYVPYTRDLAASGRMGDAARLKPIRTSTTVRVREGKRIVTDGPFAETREQLGGYYVIKTETMDEAIDLAARIPNAKDGSIEVRPVAPFETPHNAPNAAPPPHKDGIEYVFLLHDSEADWSKLGEADVKALLARYAAFAEETRATGTTVGGAPLVASTKAKTVRVRDGKRLVTDGPFAETREQLGGYMRVRARDLDEALDLAARIPAAEMGSVEVRPVHTLPAP
jgi:hypothetical protein